jgi:glutamine amidotransferase
MKKKIGIINLGSHNLFSIFQAIKNLNYHVKIVNHSKEIKRFDIIILPGVGTFNKAINLLNLKKMTY